MREEFDEYSKSQTEELNNRKIELDSYIMLQQEKLRKAEEDFRKSMTTSLTELENEKKLLELEKEKLKKQTKEFEKYKEEIEKKLETDNKNLEEKCLKFKEIINIVNQNFETFNENEGI